MRPWRPARASASSLLTRSTTLKKRPRAPPRMQARAMAMARWVLPVPVPPTRTTLRCWARNSPPARSRTRVVVDRGAVEDELVDVLGQRQPGDGHLVLDRARLLLGDLGREQVADDPLRLVLALHRGGDDLVVGGPHAEELQLAHRRPGSASAPSHGPPQAVVAGAVGGRLVPQPQRIRGHDGDRGGRLAAPGEDVQDHVGRVDAFAQRLGDRPPRPRAGRRSARR